jgi:hypothetical protein
MAITTKMEFEAVLSDIILRLGKYVLSYGANAKIDEARRGFQWLKEQAKKGDLSKEDHLPRLVSLTEVCSSEVSRDQEMSDQLMDMQDYLEFRC